MAQARSEFQKHWVCYVGNEFLMRKDAREWVDQKCKDWNKNYELIELPVHPKDIFSVVQPNDVLYIFCHGNPRENVLWMTNFDGNAKDEDGKPLKETKITPAEFLEFIKTQKLNPHHKELKIAACYSDKFAKALYLLAKNDFPEMTIHGYHNEIAILKGDKAGKLAGLSGKYIQWTGEHSEVNTDVIRKVKDYRKLFKAKNHSYEFPRDISVNLDQVPNAVFPESTYQRHSPRFEAVEGKTAHRNSTSELTNLDITGPASLSSTESLPHAQTRSTANIFASLNISPAVISQLSSVSSAANDIEGTQSSRHNTLNNSENPTQENKNSPPLEPEDNNAIIMTRKRF